MSDFLSNLAARNLNVMPEVVQPRLASLFEPHATARNPLGEPAFAAEPPGAAPASNEIELEAPFLTRHPRPRALAEFPDESMPAKHENAPDAFAPSRPPAHRTVERAFDEQPPAAEISVLSGQPPNLTVQSEPFVPRQPLLRRAEVTPPFAVVTARRDTRAEQLTSFSSPASPILHALVAPSFNTEIAPQYAAPAKLHDEETPMKPQRGSAAPPSPPAISERLIVERRIVPAEPQVSNRAIRAIQSNAVVAQPYVIPIATNTTPSAVKAEAQPTIQVTIGRIEVRATPPPAQAKKKPPTPPVMTLEEYLRQRAGGR